MPLHSRKIAVVGASGQVGRMLLKILADRGVPVSQVTGLASSKSQGRVVSYGDDETLTLSALSEHTQWQNFDIVFFAAGSKVSAKWAPIAVKAGCFVVDKSSHFRLDANVPLIVPEVNSEAIPAKAGLVSNPNCVALPLLVVLNALQKHKACDINYVSVSTYQSVSGAGHPGVQALDRQTGKHHLSTLMPNQGDSDVSSSPFAPNPIAFNVIPQIGELDEENGQTGEESKIVAEIRKVLNVSACVTCVRVPVFVGHSMVVHIVCNSAINIKAVREALQKEPSIILDEPHTYTTPIHCAGLDTIHVSRVREDGLSPNGLMLWIACDNLRKGAALNAVQIAECYSNQKTH